MRCSQYLTLKSGWYMLAFFLTRDAQMDQDAHSMKEDPRNQNPRHILEMLGNMVIGIKHGTGLRGMKNMRIPGELRSETLNLSYEWSPPQRNTTMKCRIRSEKVQMGHVLFECSTCNKTIFVIHAGGNQVAAREHARNVHVNGVPRYPHNGMFKIWDMKNTLQPGGLGYTGQQHG